MALTFTVSNGIYKVKRDQQVLGQAKSIEALLRNASTGAMPDEVYFHAAEVIQSLMGDKQDSGQIQTRVP